MLNISANRQLKVDRRRLALHYASLQSFRTVAVIPLLLPLFAFIAWRDRLSNMNLRAVGGFDLRAD